MAVNFYMHYSEDNLDINYSVNEDVDLKHLFAKFIRMTELMGYCPTSWENVIASLCDFDVERYGYSIFDWARDAASDQEI